MSKSGAFHGGVGSLNSLDILAKVNDLLLDLERDLRSAVSEEYANIFVLGVPRSGTTFITQTVFQHMDLACTNNLIARFWKTPLIGAILSKEVLGNIKESHFTSNFGSTEMPWEPHEFSWFWHDILNIRIGDGKHMVPSLGQVDWDRVRSTLIGLNAAMGRSMIHKPLELVGYCLEAFARAFNKAIFLYIERDDMDVAVSIADARVRRGDGLEHWWSSYPPQPVYEKLIDQPYNVQIAGQIKYLKKMYEISLHQIDAGHVVWTNYRTLCSDPLSILEEIQEKSARMGCEVRISATPTKRPISHGPVDINLLQELEQGFLQLEELSCD